MRKLVYVCSSWKNAEYDEFVQRVENVLGWEVYNFKKPISSYDTNHYFKRTQITFNWEEFFEENRVYEDEPQEFLRVFNEDGLVNVNFALDYSALNKADVGILLNPCGKSAHLEAGYLLGKGKDVHVILDNSFYAKPDLMYKMFTAVWHSMDDFITKVSTNLV